MNADRVRQLIAEDKLDEIENAWLEAIERGEPVQQMLPVLQTLIDARQSETAETLGWMLVSESAERGPPAKALDVARAVLPALSGDDLRMSAAKLYRQVHGQREHLEDFLRLSGLESNQSLRRAVRTIDTCLEAQPGAYLANRFDGRVACVKEFSPVSGHFELVEPPGSSLELEPKLLADEWERIDAMDFRVLSRCDPEQLADLVEADPTTVLIGVCKAHGGQIDAPALRDLLVGRFVSKDKWTGWWARARSAARRCENLSLEGSHPTVLCYHPEGQTLEEALAGAVADARQPLDYHGVLQEYAREITARGLAADPTFVEPILRLLAHHAEAMAPLRPIDALTASLTIEAAQAAGLPAPPTDYVSTARALEHCRSPAEAIAQVPEPALRLLALDTMGAREDGADHLETLLRLLPWNELDEVSGRLRRAGRDQAVEQAAANALARPTENVQICLWLWRGPAEAVSAASLKLDLLSRLLTVMQELSRDDGVDRDTRLVTFRQIRAALAANNYESFRAAVEHMDQDVAGIVKRRIERSDGISPSVRDALLGILREHFYALFLKPRVEPWLDEGVLWTTAESLHRQEAALKELLEVTMLTNSRAIRAAAEHGDLSENSEWQYAIEEQRRLRARAARLQDELALARVLQPEDVPVNSIGIGTRVALRRKADGQAAVVTILGPWDSNVEQGVISYKAPLAQALLGKAAGQQVTLRLGGSEREYVVERFEVAQQIW